MSRHETALSQSARCPIPGWLRSAGRAAGQPGGLIDRGRQGLQDQARSPGVRQSAGPQPPANVFQLVRFNGPLGKNAAYLTPDPGDGKKHPAIIWITGGDCNTIDEGCWQEGPPENDQSASAFRKAGIVMMFPSLRGGNDSPGVKEGFLGEVDDVLAATAFLAQQKHVEPSRIYLGGHSTGGTLVLLVSECSERFRAVFSFGPTDDVNRYPSEFTPFDRSLRKEVDLRSPTHWLASIKSPTFVLEGEGQGGNISALQAMARSSKNPQAHFVQVKGADHFSVLAPTTRFLADKILRDDGPTCNLTVSEAEVNKLFGR